MSQSPETEEFNYALRHAVTGTIGMQAHVHFVQGDIVQAAVDAIVVPQFPQASSPSGVGAALRRAGAEAGMQAYDNEIMRTGPQPDGAAFSSASGLKTTPYLLHTVVINDNAPQTQFDRIRDGFYNALVAAEAGTLRNIAAPALGTGNGLTAEESAKAMLGAMHKYAEEGRRAIKVNIVIHNNADMQKAFQRVLVSGAYKKKKAPGVKELSSDVRGFLYSFFNQAAMQFSESTKPIEPGLVEAVIPPRGSLAFDFRQASALARRGSLEQMNAAISTLVKKAATTTNPAEQDALEGVRLQQSLFYRGQVRDNKKLQADLGAYARGIF